MALLKKRIGAKNRVVSGTMLALIALGCANLFAAADTALSFLKIGVGARQMALANSGVAFPGGVNGSGYNPATLAELRQHEVSFLQSQWLEQTTYNYAAYAYPSSKMGTFAMSFNYLSYGQIEGYDQFNTKTSDLSASDTALGLTYARAFGRNLRIGMTARYFREDLSVVSAQGYGMDLGTFYRLPGEDWWSNLAAGFAVRNLGPSLSYLTQKVPLPLQMDLGLSYSADGRFLGTMQLHKESDSQINLSMGVEIIARKFITLRAGYKTQKGLQPNLTAGLGLEIWENLSFDYAFIPFENFNSIHRMGLSFRFGGIAKRHYNKGVRLMRSGKFAEAILEFDLVLQQDPTNHTAAAYMKRCARELRRQQP